VEETIKRKKKENNSMNGKEKWKTEKEKENLKNPLK